MKEPGFSLLTAGEALHQETLFERVMAKTNKCYYGKT
jgi:hypothetical protein